MSKQLLVLTLVACACSAGCSAKKVHVGSLTCPPVSGPGQYPAQNPYLTWVTSGNATLYTMDIDAASADPNHPQVCLSASGGDTITWIHSNDAANKNRKLGFPIAKSNNGACKSPFKGSHPGSSDFRNAQTIDGVDGIYESCAYKLTFKRSTGPDTDPHISVGN